MLPTSSCETRRGGRALLVERFDRTTTGGRRRVVSALTVLGLTRFPEGRYATYANLAHKIRAEFSNPAATLRELFRRIAFNMLCANTDDNGRITLTHRLRTAPTRRNPYRRAGGPQRQDWAGSGSDSTVTVPTVPSTSIMAPCGIRFEASVADTTQGMPSSRLTMMA